jgi:hypothetical protein
VGQAYFLDVEPGLHLAEHDVVDAAFVTEPDEGGAFACEERETKFGVLLLQVQRGGAVVPVGMQDQQVRLVLGAQPVDDLWRGAEFGGGLRHRGERLLDGGGLREMALLFDGGVAGQPGLAHHLRQQQPL